MKTQSTFIGPSVLLNVLMLYSRAEDDLSSDDEVPVQKRLKHLKRTNFPDIMATNSKGKLQHLFVNRQFFVSQ